VHDIAEGNVGRPEPIVNEDDLAGLGAQLDAPSRIRFVDAIPGEGDAVVIVTLASSLTSETYRLFVVEAAGAVPRLVSQLENVSLGRPQFSPDGAWMSVMTGPRQISSSTVPQALHVIQLAEGGISATVGSLSDVPATASWSADGQWLARAGGRYLELFFPRTPSPAGTPYRKVLDSGFGACYGAVWRDR
jgi:hypothetical protein